MYFYWKNLAKEIVCNLLTKVFGIGINTTSTPDLGSPSQGLIPLGQIKQEPDSHTPSRRRAKLKPDLKLKVNF